MLWLWLFLYSPSPYLDEIKPAFSPVTLWADRSVVSHCLFLIFAFFQKWMVKKKLLLDLHLVNEEIFTESFLNSSYRLLHFSLCKQFCFFFNLTLSVILYLKPILWSALYIQVTLPRRAYKNNIFESLHRYPTTYFCACLLQFILLCVPKYLNFNPISDSSK